MAIAAPAGRAHGDEDGVGARARPRARSVSKESRPALTLAATTSSRPGSKMGMPPDAGSRPCWHPCRCRRPHGRIPTDRRPTPARHNPCRSSRYASSLQQKVAFSRLKGSGIQGRGIDQNTAATPKGYVHGASPPDTSGWAPVCTARFDANGIGCRGRRGAAPWPGTPR